MVWSTFTKESPNHPSWLRYEPTNKDKPPRATTYVNKSQITAAQITQIPLPFSDAVALQINPRNKREPPTVIVNVYNPCDASIISELHETMKQIKLKDGTITIVAGDFNCHHPVWNPSSYTRHDKTADQLIDMAAELGLN